MRGKVIILTTGGTVAMRFDAAKGGEVPAVSGEELVEAIPPLKDICKVEVVEFSNIPSPHMSPSRMLLLGQAVEKCLVEKDVLGVVITHGTDTLEETACFLDLFVASDKPVCMTAAMRSAGEISPDGPHNILDAVRVAASLKAKKQGVLVVMNKEIHAARDVTKTHTASTNTFSTPFWGALGYVDQDEIIFRRSRTSFKKIHPERIAEKVYLVKLVAGSDDLLFNALIVAKVEGLVVEGFGRGNVTPAAAIGIKNAIDAGIAVVLTSRCPSGRVLEVYAYEGGAKQLLDYGAIFADELSGQKARIKLMLALGKTRKMKELKSYFEDALEK